MALDPTESNRFSFANRALLDTTSPGCVDRSPKSFLKEDSNPSTVRLIARSVRLEVAVRLKELSGRMCVNHALQGKVARSFTNAAQVLFLFPEGLLAFVSRVRATPKYSKFSILN